jgi:hypothetical protein
MSYYSGAYQAPTCGVFYSGANNGNLDCQVNVNDLNSNASERETISNSIREAINRFGSTVAYYVNTYNVNNANNIYGENPTSAFYGPTNIVMYVQLSENSVTLRRFGFDSGDTITAYVHISSYSAVFSPLSVYPSLSQAIEPKAGDVFQMIQYGATRPGDRNGKFFEITERVDQEMDDTSMNPLGGHYMWKLRARRLDFSFEPGLSGEKGAAQVFDNALNGILSGGSGTQAPSPSKSYPGSADAESINIFDQRVNNTSVYGEYGYNT